MRLNDPELLIWSLQPGWPWGSRPLFHPGAFSLDLRDKSMVKIRNIKSSYCVKTVTVMREYQDFIILYIRVPLRNIYTSLWGEAGVNMSSVILYNNAHLCNNLVLSIVHRRLCLLLSSVYVLWIGIKLCKWRFSKLSRLVFLLCTFTFLKHLLTGLERFLFCGYVFMMFIYTLFVQVMFFFIV